MIPAARGALPCETSAFFAENATATEDIKIISKAERTKSKGIRTDVGINRTFLFLRYKIAPDRSKDRARPRAKPRNTVTPAQILRGKTVNPDRKTSPAQIKVARDTRHTPRRKSEGVGPWITGTKKTGEAVIEAIDPHNRADKMNTVASTAAVFAAVFSMTLRLSSFFQSIFGQRTKHHRNIKPQFEKIINTYAQKDKEKTHPDNSASGISAGEFLKDVNILIHLSTIVNSFIQNLLIFFGNVFRRAPKERFPVILTPDPEILQMQNMRFRSQFIRLS